VRAGASLHSASAGPEASTPRDANRRLSFGQGKPLPSVSHADYVTATARRLVETSRDCAMAYYAERDGCDDCITDGHAWQTYVNEQSRLHRQKKRQAANQRLHASNPRAAGLVPLPGWRDAGATMDVFDRSQSRLPPVAAFERQRVPTYDERSPVHRLLVAIARSMNKLIELFHSWHMDLTQRGVSVRLADLCDAVGYLQLDNGEGWGASAAVSLYRVLGLRPVPDEVINWTELVSAMTKRQLEIGEVGEVSAAARHPAARVQRAIAPKLPSRKNDAAFAAEAQRVNQRHLDEAGRVAALASAQRSQLLGVLRTRSTSADGAAMVRPRDLQRALAALSIPCSSRTLKSLYAQLTSAATATAGNDCGIGVAAGRPMSLEVLDTALQRRVVSYDLRPEVLERRLALPMLVPAHAPPPTSTAAGGDHVRPPACEVAGGASVSGLCDGLQGVSPQEGLPRISSRVTFTPEVRLTPIGPRKAERKGNREHDGALPPLR